jgi:hypothetical protein
MIAAGIAVSDYLKKHLKWPVLPVFATTLPVMFRDLRSVGALGLSRYRVRLLRARQGALSTGGGFSTDIGLIARQMRAGGMKKLLVAGIR